MSRAIPWANHTFYTATRLWVSYRTRSSAGSSRLRIGPTSSRRRGVRPPELQKTRPDRPALANFRRYALSAGAEGRPGPAGAGTKRSIVWGAGGSKALNVVGGKILVPPTGRALYYIANREKGV